MFVTSISYQNKQTGWTLQKTNLDSFNLLVGASGAGKTQILRALNEIQNLALRGKSRTPMKFNVEFHHNDIRYEWGFESSPSDLDLDILPNNPSASTITVTQEKLTSSSDDILVDRNQDRFLFKGKELPQLNRAESAFKLLDEQPMLTIHNALVNGFLDDHPHKATASFNSTAEKALLERVQNLNAWMYVPTLPSQLKAFLLKTKHPDQFNSLKSTFLEIFPSVEDISVELITTQSTDQQIAFKLKENGIPHWVSAEDISSGMLRTLIHLVDLSIAPRNSVVVIDEFENSLGVNCMGPLTEFILSRAPELQFIITSHHPYIINKIPKAYWKVVRRHGSIVQVTPAKEVRALQGSSAQDDFTRLINAPEFEEGIA